jgi:hypothetical protein
LGDAVHIEFVEDIIQVCDDIVLYLTTPPDKNDRRSCQGSTVRDHPLFTGNNREVKPKALTV